MGLWALGHGPCHGRVPVGPMAPKGMDSLAVPDRSQGFTGPTVLAPQGGGPDGTPNWGGVVLLVNLLVIC